MVKEAMMTEKRARKIIRRADFISRYAFRTIVAILGLMIVAVLGFGFGFKCLHAAFLFAIIVFAIVMYPFSEIVDWASSYYLKVWCLQGVPQLCVLQKSSQWNPDKEIMRFFGNFPVVSKMKKKVVELELPVDVRRSLHFTKYRKSEATEVTVAMIYDFVDFEQFYSEVVEGQKCSFDSAMADLTKQVQNHWESLDFWGPDKIFHEESELSTTLMVRLAEGAGVVSPRIHLRSCKVFFKSTAIFEFRVA